MDPELVQAVFSFGLRVAEHVHGIRRSGDDQSNAKIYETVHAVRDGGLTLLGTPEEMIASLPSPPAGMKLNVGPEFYEMMRASREKEKTIAKIVADALPK